LVRQTVNVDACRPAAVMSSNLLSARNVPMSTEIRLSPPFAKGAGQCWIVTLSDPSIPPGDSLGYPAQSMLTFLEDDNELGPAHTGHRLIETNGGGSFSHWGDRLWFSTSDGSDPNRNGRTYKVAWETIDPIDPTEFFSQTALGKTRKFLNAAAKSNRLKEAIDELMSLMSNPAFQRNDFYSAKEYLLFKLLEDLRIVQGSSLRTFNIAKSYVETAQRTLGDLTGISVLELGPGPTLSAGIVFRELGAKEYFGVDIFRDPTFNTRATLQVVQELTRMSFCDFVDNFNGRPLGYVNEGPISDNIDLDDKRIHFVRPRDFYELPYQAGTIDFLFSHFTFEHAQKPNELIDEIARVLRPGGVTSHFIDIEDHSDFSRPFDYLVYSDEEWDACYGPEGRPVWMYENRLRASDFRNLFEKSGLKVVESNPLRSAKMPDDIRRRLAPRFLDYSQEDLETVWYLITCRKPLS
jgi:SAM-dependent methyltransferase